MAARAKNKIIISVCAAFIITAGIVGLYRWQSMERFDKVTLWLRNQDVTGLDTSVKIGNKLSAFTDSLDLTTTDAARIKSFKADLLSIKADIDQTCAAKNNDLTSASVKSLTEKLWLTKQESQYIRDWESLVDSLNQTSTSNTVMCHDGKLMVSIYENFLLIQPAFAAYSEAMPAEGAPSDGQLAAMRKVADIRTFENEETLKKEMPEVVSFLKCFQVTVTSYIGLTNAVKAKDSNTILIDIQALLDSTGKLQNQMLRADNEIRLANATMVVNDRMASEQEFNLIDRLKLSRANYKYGHGDYKVPAMRLINAEISQYIAENDGKLPEAKNLPGLINALNVASPHKLASKKLGGVAYVKAGNKAHLTATLATGSRIDSLFIDSK